MQKPTIPTKAQPAPSAAKAPVPRAPSAAPVRQPAPAKRGRGALIAGVAVVALLGAAGGGYYLYARDASALKKAEQFAAKGDMRAAQIEFRNAVRDEPNNPEPHLRLAQVQMQLSEPVAAEKEFKTARDLGADRWSIIPQLGAVYLAQNRFNDVLTEVPPDGPKPEVAAKNLVLRSMAQVGLNDIPAATASLLAAEKVAPGNAEVLLTGARLALALRDYPLAEKRADEVLAANPKMIDALLVKGQILAAKGDKEGALKIADQAVEVDPNSAPARLDRANQLLLAGQDDKARTDLAAVLAQYPRNAGATYLNGVLLVRAGKYAEAQTELQKMTPLVNRFPRTLYFQALASANLGQTEAAIDLAQRYMARVPNDGDGVRLLARAELAAQRPERAVAALNKAIAAGQNDAPTLDLLGRAYAQLGRTTEAVDTFKKASAADPGNPQILTHLASSEMQAGDPNKAAAALEKSVEIAPTQPNTAEALVAASLAAGDLDKAETSLAALKARAGDTEPVGILTGMLRLAKLDLDGGRAAFADTLKRFPDSVSAKLNLAKVLILQRRQAEGEALLREILAKDPTNVAVLNTSIQLLSQAGQFPQAIQLLEAAKAAAPKNLMYTAMMSDVMVRSGDPRRAVAMLQAMRSQEELPPILLAALGRAQSAANMVDEAKKTFADVLKVAPGDLDVRRGQIELLLRAKDYPAAMASLKEGLAQSPGNIGVMSAMVTLESQTSGPDAGMKLADQLRADPANLPNSAVLKGDELMKAGQYGAAVAAFRVEYVKTPTVPLLLRLANALSSDSKDAEAAALLREGLERTPGEADVAQMLGLLDVKAERWKDAEKNLSVVLAKRPNDPVAMNNLAWVYQVLGDNRARNLAQRAYLQAPSPETGDTLGWVMAKQGDAKPAVSLLQQANGQRPENGTIKFHLAYALNEAGRKEDAIKALQELVATTAAFPERQDARKLLDALNAAPGAAPAGAPGASAPGAATPGAATPGAAPRR